MRGLYNLSGNVWDWYGTYPGGAVTDCRGPATGEWRGIRGGSFNDRGFLCRSASRLSASPSEYGKILGFRVVLAPVEPQGLYDKNRLTNYCWAIMAWGCYADLHITALVLVLHPSTP